MHIGVEDRQSLRTGAKPAAPRHRKAIVIAIIVVVCMVVGLIVAWMKWPFTQDNITQSLAQQAGSTVKIGHFREVFFPHPGCVADNIVFHRSVGSGPTFLVIHKLTVIGSYHGLLADHLSTVRMDGLHMIILRPQPPNTVSSLPTSVGALPAGESIGEVIADGSVVEFRKPGQDQPYEVFSIPKLAFHDLQGSNPLQYQASIKISQPPAELEVSGKFGPWEASRPGQAVMSGAYELKKLDLGAFSAFGGTVTSKGNFDGVLQSVKVQGSADTPNFVLRSSGHLIHMAADFGATVNGLNGDVSLDAMQLRYGGTTIVGAGTIAAENGAPGKTVRLQLSSKQARIQDLLWPFISDAQPPITGPIVFRGDATLPPGSQSFLNRVQLQGDFGISDAKYPNPQTQKTIDVLSAKARGKAGKLEDIDDKLGSAAYDPGRVLSNVTGHVLLTHGIAKLTDISFRVPGAHAHMNGTYDLHNYRIDLHGHMWMDTSLSKATTGVKAFLMKIIEPFTKKGRTKGSIVSLTIGGTYENPTYTALPESR